MSGQTFTFPPPPPPPPRRANENHNAPSRGRGHISGPPRGRGGLTRGRGQGHHAVRGRGRGTLRGQLSQHSPPGTSEPARAEGSSYSPHRAQNSHALSQHKRDHTTAFGGDALRRSRPPAAPAVPSFTASLANLLPTQSPPHSLQHSQPPPKERSKNALGLTPMNVEQSDSEDDEEEEKRLAQGEHGQNLQFSYRGEPATLRTAAEIAAWVAERKRRYPTQAKREAAQKVADEKRKHWEAEKQARLEASRLAKESRQQSKKEASLQKSSEAPIQTTSIQHDPTQAARLHAERLRRRALKAQRDLAAAEAALEVHQRKSEPTASPHVADASSDDDSLGTVSDSSELSNGSEPSSSESGSDDDAPPEVQSSKVQVYGGFKDGVLGSRTSQRLCTAFSKTGKCRFGARCRFSHERKEAPSHGKEAQTRSKGGRKGLFQVMVEKEQEEEQRRVLSAIIALGKQGLLEQPS